MSLPFTPGQFFDVLGAYNRTLWPAAVALWLVSAWAVVQLWRAPRSRSLAALLAVHWGWSAIAYHALFFTRINPMAWAFAAMFLVQGALLTWHGVMRAQLQFRFERSARGACAVSLTAYAMAYPLLALVGPHDWPRVPAFGVPCPTTLLTMGMLCALPPRPPWSLITIPIVWAPMGSIRST
jgi:hypothetical protein